MKHQNTILAVGSLAFDTIQTPTGKADKVLGGSANYFSIAASFYSPVQIVGVVGDDFPKAHLNWLQERRIDTSGVEFAKGNTFHWVGAYEGSMNEAKTLSTFLNVFEHFNPKLDTNHQNATHLFLANIDPVLQQSVLKQVKAPQLVAADSMNFWITGKPDELKKTLRSVDILSINESEAALISGQKNLMSAAQTIRDMGPSVIIIKRGEYGAIVFTPRGIFMAPAFPVSNVVDPTGAGDTFAGAMMGFLADCGASKEMLKSDPEQFDHALRLAVLNGCVMASFTVEDFSIHRLMRLERHEVNGRLDSMLKMIRI